MKLFGLFAMQVAAVPSGQYCYWTGNFKFSLTRRLKGIFQNGLVIHQTMDVLLNNFVHAKQILAMLAAAGMILSKVQRSVLSDNVSDFVTFLTV